MHLFIDIRTSRPEDAPIIRYAHNWLTYWKEENPHDTVTFLTLPEQAYEYNEPVFRIPKTKFLTKKSLRLKNSHGSIRCINFSAFPPYDASIPTTTHIFEMGSWFYDSATNANYLKRRLREYTIRALLSKSKHLIVPNIALGGELAELWNISETKIHVIPFLSFDDIEPDDSIHTLHNIQTPFFIHESHYGKESNIEEIICAFGKYIHEFDGKATLLLLGNTGNELIHITRAIREAALTQHIKIIGCLDNSGQEALYRKAAGWIALGAYDTSRVNIALARSKHIPLLLSDIRMFDTYNDCLKIHPNHLDALPALLKKLEESPLKDVFIPSKNAACIQEYKKILSLSE